jgi:hypothetical protein
MSKTDYRHAMDMVEEVERGPISKFSAETRCFADLIRSVDDEWKDASGLERGGDPDGVTPQDLRNYLMRLTAFVEGLAEGDCSYHDGCPAWSGSRHGQCVSCRAREVLGVTE